MNNLQSSDNFQLLEKKKYLPSRKRISMPRGTELPNSLRPIVEADLENGSPLFFLVPRLALKIIVHRAPREDASHHGQIFLVHGCIVTGTWTRGRRRGRSHGTRCSESVVEGGRRKGGSLFVNDVDARSAKEAKWKIVELCADTRGNRETNMYMSRFTIEILRPLMETV